MLGKDKKNKNNKWEDKNNDNFEKDLDEKKDNKVSKESCDNKDENTLNSKNNSQENNANNELIKKIKILESQNLTLKQELEDKNKRINDLDKQLNHINSNYKSEIMKKAQEAQALLDAKLKENQNKTDLEIKNIKKYALKDKAIDLINIISNFEMALSSKPTDPAVQNYLIGFEMFLSMFKNYLSDNNIVEISIKENDPFDDKTMSPLEVQASDSVKSNHVIKVVKKGYKLYDLVIVHATVIVAK